MLTALCAIIFFAFAGSAKAVPIFTTFGPGDAFNTNSLDVVGGSFAWERADLFTVDGQWMVIGAFSVAVGTGLGVQAARQTSGGGSTIQIIRVIPGDR